MSTSLSDASSDTLSRPLRARRVMAREVDGELVLYDATRQRVHALNPTAAFVWQACDGQHDANAIVAMLAERYPESAASIAEDVPATLAHLRQEGLLTA